MKAQYEEAEYDFTMYADSPDTFKEEYPDMVNMDLYYIDQAGVNLDLRKLGGPTISSFFTPHGIKKLESWMCRQISEESKFTSIELESLIRRNPHIHNVIKTNLLNNLKNKHGN